jgi:class 3 adenylate cyclase/predicted ATPase
MFCDLVESTELSQRLDPEDLREILRAYQKACAEVIESFGGRIAQYLGDGLLVYFGDPAAHEDDAIRAVSAALRIQQAIPALHTGFAREIPALAELPLRARIAIHTGRVVVGAIGDRERLAHGDAVNIAARLEGLAEAGEVLISSATRNLLRESFVLEDAGEHALKGVAERARLFKVLRAAGRRGRFPHTTSPRLPLVGRDPQLAALLALADQARQGAGRLAWLEGEAGIGKSRLVLAMRESLPGDAWTWLECQGSPFRESSAFYPIIELLEAMLDLAADAPAEARAARLRAVLERTTLDPAASLPLFADLLSLPLERAALPSPLTPETQRRLTLAALCDWILAQARKQPAVLVVEDVHWVDPSTLELLALVVDAAAHAPLLVLLVSRPGAEPAWLKRAAPHRLELAGLTEPQAAQMIQGITGARALASGVVDLLVEKADGVPLFVEELTRNALEAGIGAADRSGDGAGVAELAVPSTLEDSLMARLDRLGPAKEVAQVASVLGRRFGTPLLSAVLDTDPASLAPILETLVEADLLHRTDQEGGLHFRHSLLQDTAYQSLLKRSRQGWHARVAETLKQRFSELTQSQPEVLARHLEGAGALHDAAAYRRRAGELASRRGANTEAIQHLTRGIELVRSLPPGPERDRQEALLELALGVPLQAARGYADPEVRKAYGRTLELTRGWEGPEAASLRFRAVFGLFQHHNSRADIKVSLDLAAQLLELARAEGDRAWSVLGHAASGTAQFWRGEPALSTRDAEQTISLYDPESHGSLAHAYGQDPGVAARGHGSCALAQLGRAELGLAWIENGIERARDAHGPFDLAFALSFAGIFHAILGEHERTRARAEEAMAVSIEHGFPLWLGVSRLLRGWAIAAQGDTSEGIREIRLGMAEQIKTGNQAGAPLGMGMLAETHLRAGDLRRAGDALTLGLTLSEQSGTRLWDAELQRLQGEVLLLQGPAGEAGAVECFERSLATARAHGMRTSELRTALRLARRHLERAETSQARSLLEPRCREFPADVKLPDLVAARSLLETTR